MRTIPPDLLNRVKKKWQVKAENADPKMKILLSRGFLNELFQVFTIQEGAELTDVDVTVRRPDTTALPTEAFALAINNGVAEVKSKSLPYDDQIPWADEFTVNSGVSSVAIEFDGYWDRDYKTRRFNFVTEDYPWIFYVQGGNLNAQYYDGEPNILATDVTKVAAIRGWLPANGDQSNDQGLIVAYIKADGNMYYRSYAIQDNALKMWELERQVTVFSGIIDALALFRTNDFRIGFMAEIAGNVWWTLTARNYAGMSIWPDNLAADVSAEIELTPITYINSYTPDETLLASAQMVEYELCATDVPDPALVSVKRLGLNKIVLEFNQYVIDFAGSESAFTVSINSGATIYGVLSVSAGTMNEEIILTLHEDVAADVNLDILYNEFEANIRTYVTDYCRRLISSFTATAKGAPPYGYHEETITAAVTAEIKFNDFTRLTGYNDDHIITASISALIEFWHVDEAPL